MGGMNPVYDGGSHDTHLPSMPCSIHVHRPFRYAFKATVWLAIYSHIGNYWYTHYFYTVLRAKYTMPSW